MDISFHSIPNNNGAHISGNVEVIKIENDSLDGGWWMHSKLLELPQRAHLKRREGRAGSGRLLDFLD